MSVANTGLCEGVRNLYDKPEFSDFKIKCGTRTINVHKTIISCQGGFFKRLIGKGFQEAETGVADLSSDDVFVVEAVLQYLYTIPYKIPEGYQAPTFYATVYAAAEYYQLPLLKQDCFRRFQELPLDTVARRNELFAATSIIYKTTAEHHCILRNLLVSIINTHIRELVDNSQANQLILKNNPQLCYDLVRVRAAQPNGAHPDLDVRGLCRKCNSVFALAKTTMPLGSRRNIELHCPQCRQRAMMSGFVAEYEQSYGKMN